MTQTDWHQKCFYRVSLKAIIRNDKNQILMVSEYEDSNLSLPGGGLDYGESEHECLKRELFEEIGLTSDFSEKLLHMQTVWLETKQAWLMWLAYEISYEDLKYSIGKDGISTRWVDETELTSSNAHYMIKNILEKL